MSPLTNSSGKPLYVLRRISDKFVINARAISNTTGLPNPGPDQEYLPIMTEVAPDHDPVFTVRTQTEGPNEVTHQWEITYVVQDRPTAEKLAAAENAKRFEVQRHVPPQDFTEMVVRTLAAVLRDAKGLALTPDEEALKNRLVEKAAILKQNDDNLTDLKTAIEAGSKPDLSAGWVSLP